jgi:hypothetical protein
MVPIEGTADRCVERPACARTNSAQRLSASKPSPADGYLGGYRTGVRGRYRRNCRALGTEQGQSCKAAD